MGCLQVAKGEWTEGINNRHVVVRQFSAVQDVPARAAVLQWLAARHEKRGHCGGVVDGPKLASEAIDVYEAKRCLTLLAPPIPPIYKQTRSGKRWWGALRWWSGGVRREMK